jgi:hypothetical protein
MYFVDTTGYASEPNQPGASDTAAETPTEDEESTLETVFKEPFRQVGDMIMAGIVYVTNEGTGHRYQREIFKHFDEKMLKSNLARAARQGMGTTDLLNKMYNPVEILKDVGKSVGEGLGALVVHGDPVPLLEAVALGAIAVEGVRVPTVRVINGGARLYRTGRILTKFRVSKRYTLQSNLGTPMQRPTVMSRLVEHKVAGTITPKDAWILAGTSVEHGVSGAACVGGFSKSSWRAFKTNIKAWKEGRKGLGRGIREVEPGGMRKYGGDVDWIVIRKDKPVMTDYVKARRLNAEMDAPHLDTSRTHGILGSQMPDELIPQGVLAGSGKTRIKIKERFGGKPVEAYKYQKYGIPTTLHPKGRAAFIRKPGSSKVTIRDPNPNAFIMENWWATFNYQGYQHAPVLLYYQRQYMSTAE